VAVKLTKENPDYEITIAKEGIKKIPSLDFDEEDVKKIADKIVKDLSNLTLPFGLFHTNKTAMA